MNHSISQFLIFLIGIILALFISFSIFTTGGNGIGETFRYLVPLALAFGFFKPKLGLYFMVLASISMDTIKRLMILDFSIHSFDIAAVQAFAPALGIGIIGATLFKLIISVEQFGKSEKNIFIGAQLLAILIGLGYLINSDLSAKGFGDVINSSVYISLLGCLPKLFNKYEDCIKFFKFLLIAYIPVALWTIRQGIWGITDFEMQYLLSGLTIEVRQLNQRVFRCMGTLASAASMSYTASILAASLLMPFSWRESRFKVQAVFHPGRIFALVIFLGAAYFTYSRTGWVVGGIALIIFLIIRSKLLTYVSVLAGVVSLALLIIFAQQIIDTKVLNRFQAEIMEEHSESAEEDQILVLGTVNQRFESLANLTNNPEVWTPFGMKLSEVISGKEHGYIYAHDAITELLVLLGYIPLGGIIIVVPIAALKFYRKVYQLQPSQAKAASIYFFSLGGGLVLVALGQLKSMFIFPVNMFWAILIGFGISCYLQAVRNDLDEYQVE